MRLCRYLVLSVVAILALACATPGGKTAAFHSVDLRANLGLGDLRRYEAETAEAAKQEQPDPMPCIEKTNWWLPSLVAYWNKGSVRAMAGPGGDRTYMVSKTQGYGPLAVLWVSKEDAVYAADGNLSSVMEMDSVFWGHLAMIHNMRWRLPDGSWHNHSTSHLLHHILSVENGHGGGSVSLFSAPNPLGFDYE